MKYRKKPVDVDAIQWSGNNLKEIIDFTGLHASAKEWVDKGWQHYEEVVKINGLKIFTEEGPLSATVGDYIVRGYTEKLGYHFWPVKPDYFEQSYYLLTDLSTLK